MNINGWKRNQKIAVAQQKNAQSVVYVNLYSYLCI